MASVRMVLIESWSILAEAGCGWADVDITTYDAPFSVDLNSWFLGVLKNYDTEIRLQAGDRLLHQQSHLVAGPEAELLIKRPPIRAGVQNQSPNPVCGTPFESCIHQAPGDSLPPIARFRIHI